MGALQQKGGGMDVGDNRTDDTLADLGMSMQKADSRPCYTEDANRVVVLNIGPE
jgi:hypothetical protein